LLGVPYVVSVDSLRHGWGQFLISGRRCVRIIVPARSIAFNIASVYGRFAERIEQVNLGTFVDEPGRSFRRKEKLLCVVTAGDPSRANDFENLLGAVRHLRLEGYEFMLVILGHGRDEEQLRAMIRWLGLTQVVTIVPQLECWRSVIGAGDVFVQTAVSDAFNPFLLEAMSVGAAVAGCHGGVDDLLIEDRTAVVFEPDDELSLKSALRRLFDEPVLARKLADEAQRYLQQNHKVSDMVSSMLRVYQEAQLGNGGQV
jgi:glycosyltransferase involved in cell wall biosynthesis